MKRNRSVRTLPLDNLNLLKHPLPEASTPLNNEKLCFGEEIQQRSAIFDGNYLSSDDSDILISVRDLGNSKSSSSSLSWGEEYKSEASKLVRDELERMDRVLRGVEPIPENYDKEEYQEWMEFFPNLCIVGTKNGTFVESTGKPYYKSEQVCSKDGCDKLETGKNAPNSIDIDSFLKVSPLGGVRLPRRQSSSRSLISSQISASKWLKDEEYNSLPFLSGMRKSGVPKGILKNSLVLPPIETNQFRSVSATPRRESKSLSALSDQKYSGFKRKV